VTSAPKTPRKERVLRFRKNDPEHNLLAATQQWVLAHGGGTTVIGGIEVQRWGESPYHFRVAVQCLGRAPEIKK
jgi:hypothetical protein